MSGGAWRKSPHRDELPARVASRGTGGVVADCSERRNLTRAQQAMRLALLYSEPDKGDLGKTIKRERKELARGHAGGVA